MRVARIGLNVVLRGTINMFKKYSDKLVSKFLVSYYLITGGIPENRGFNKINGLPLRSRLTAIYDRKTNKVLCFEFYASKADEKCCELFRGGIDSGMIDLDFPDNLLTDDLIGLNLKKFKSCK